MIVKEITIHIVLNKINVGNDFLILAQIRKLEVIKVKRWNHQISTPNTSPGIIIAALDIQAAASIIL